MSAAVETARVCLCGNALSWTACCELPVCTDCEPGPWAAAADGSGEFGHVGPCPGHNMAGYPLTGRGIAELLAIAIDERDRARAVAVALEQDHARLLRDLHVLVRDLKEYGEGYLPSYVAERVSEALTEALAGAL